VELNDTKQKMTNQLVDMQDAHQEMELEHHVLVLEVAQVEVTAEILRKMDLKYLNLDQRKHLVVVDNRFT
jgi:hypothetical protein